MISLCSALEIDPSEVTLAILSYYVKSPQMGVFKREDYINGWVAMGDVDTLEKQKKMMHKIKEDLLNDSAVRGNRTQGEKVAGSGGTFNRVYDFVYSWGRQEGQKQLGEFLRGRKGWDMGMRGLGTRGHGEMREMATLSDWYMNSMKGISD